MTGQRLNTWQSGGGERLWLSRLVRAMEEASRPEVRTLPCEAAVLQALRAQLALPVSRYPYVPSAFSLRN
jgi:biotin-(acetyl-CoA carboxylase) ligase